MTTDRLVLPLIHYVFKREKLPSGALIEHVAKFHDLVYVVEGHVTYIVDGIHYPLESGHAAYIPQGVKKRVYVKPEDTMISYSCLFHCSESVPRSRLPLNIVSRNPDANLLRGLFEELHNCWVTMQAGYLLRSTAYLMMVMAELNFGVNVKDVASVSPHIQKAQSYIARYIHLPLSTAHLADLCCLHPIYFAALFRKETGLSVKGYINRQRVQKAKVLLESGQYKVFEAAHHCGFEDALYFSKVFKKYMGIAPTEYLKSNKKT